MVKTSFSKCLGLFLFFSGAVLKLAAQQPDTLLSVLETNYPQEKIYVQYDRPYYNPGETIWFKAYLFAANLPSAISKTLYAELIDDKGTVLERKTIPVLGAGAAGDFIIPDSTRSSLVYVRAYTPWMLNFDSSFLYLKPIRIIIPSVAADKTKKDPVLSLQFFPEGGDLVQGLESRVAFKATDDQGFPVTAKGDILDSKGQKITSFSDVHDGMGFFSIRPAAGEKYKAKWKDSKGVTHETPIPAAKETGVVIGVSNIANDITYTLNRTEDIPAEARAFQVIAQMQQQTVYMARINLTVKNMVKAPIPTEGLPDGIMQVTLFTSDGKPIAERIVFINHHNYYFITDIHTTQKDLTKKAKNIIQVDVGDTLVTNLSVSITDAGTTFAPDEENIYSHILLSSDIKGYVHNPAYYFASKADSLQSNLDLVMMTNGWRRFRWEDVMAQRWPVIKNYPQQFVTVKGSVLGLRETDLVGKDLSIIMQTKKGNNQFLTVPVSRKGEFLISDLLFYDTAKLYYQFNNDKNKTLTSTASFDFRNAFILLPDKPVTGLRPLLKPVLPDSATLRKNQRLTSLRKNDFVEGQQVKELEGVEVKARQKSTQQKMDEEYTSGLFSGGDGYTFILSEDPSANASLSILDYLRGKVAGLQITSTCPQGGQLSWRGGSPSLFLNEMTSDVSMIQSTPMSDVAMIKVFRPPFFGAPGGGSGGAIAIYTKKGERIDHSVKGLNFIAVTGYSPVREFYSPDYSATADKNKNDYRTTLYWNPYLVFDKSNRRVMIPFYNNDSCKKIRVVIEGINEEGKLTREVKFFE